MKLSQLYLAIAFCWTAQIWCMVEQNKTVKDLFKSFSDIMIDIIHGKPSQGTIVPSFRQLILNAKNIENSNQTLTPDEKDFVKSIKDLDLPSDNEVYLKLVKNAVAINNNQNKEVQKVFEEWEQKSSNSKCLII